MNPIDSTVQNDSFQEQKCVKKVILLGTEGVGKSKLLLRYLYGAFQQRQKPTVGIDFVAVSRKSHAIHYYDTAGGERYRSLLKMYYRNCDAAILMYSVSDRKSFDELDYYLKLVSESEPNCMIYVVGCKGDTQAEVSERQVAEKYPKAKRHRTSARLNKGVKALFEDIEVNLLVGGENSKGIKLRNFFDFEHRRVKKNGCC